MGDLDMRQNRAIQFQQRNYAPVRIDYGTRRFQVEQQKKNKRLAKIAVKQARRKIV